MPDEILSTEEQMYDVKKYKDEIATYIRGKKIDLDQTSKMQATYNELYASVYAGSVREDVERFPHSAEMFKVYKSSIIEACLSGYSALLEIQGRNAESMLKVPELKNVMIDQFKSIALLENLTGDTLDDWILKGESVSFIKLVETKEQYRTKVKAIDATTGEEVMQFKMNEFVSHRDIQVDRINPFDFFVDAFDYQRNPRGCPKIIRSWIDKEIMLTSNAYPLLTKQDKEDICNGIGRNGTMRMEGREAAYSAIDTEISKTDRDRIEVLTFYGDYITTDFKVLRNIKCTLVGGRCADIRYCDVNTNRIIYAGYKIDEQTHRSISPLAICKPINTLMNRCTDMFLNNLEDVSVPYILYQKGSMNKTDVESARKNKEIEYNSIESKPEFWAPPASAPQGLSLIELIVAQNKNVLGLNNYLAGNTDGAVRTARESAILFQKANARMRVETDVFSYRYLLSLFVAFYAFNRELALSLGEPLNEIYADKSLDVSISTNASRADKEGELQRLIQMLQLPIAQMIFANLQPEQVKLAVRYLMAKAELSDVDNILQLMQDNATLNQPPEVAVGGQGQIGFGGLTPNLMPTDADTEQSEGPNDSIDSSNEPL